MTDIAKLLAADPNIDPALRAVFATQAELQAKWNRFYAEAFMPEMDESVQGSVVAEHGAMQIPGAR